MTNELGEFLRARRTNPALASADGADPRRRTSGLRREEVAAASGISVDYYTRLEQGRVGHPSDAVLEALARALRLSRDARDHLFRLRPGIASVRTGSEDPGVRAGSDDPGARARLAALVEAVSPNPAYILDRLSTMVAANAEGLALYAGIGDLAPADRNTCRYLMTDPRARDRFVEWEEIARGAVAHLRSANADDLSNPDLQSLTSELRSRSPLFDGWWNEHLVERRRGSLRHLRTDEGDVVARRYDVLYLPDDGLRMTLWYAG